MTLLLLFDSLQLRDIERRGPRTALANSLFCGGIKCSSEAKMPYDKWDLQQYILLYIKHRSIIIDHGHIWVYVLNITSTFLGGHWVITVNHVILYQCVTGCRYSQ